MNVLLYAVVAVAPTAVFVLAGRALRWWEARQAAQRTQQVTTRPLEDRVADLRRLGQEYSRIRASDLPHRSVRLAGVGLAYDDALCACCAALEIEVAGRPPLSATQRLGLEAALARAGVVW